MPAAPDREARKGFLSSCLVDSDPVLEKRARRVKQRALLVSILLQILIVAALILMPLLSKGENIAGRAVVPTVPYAPSGSPRHDTNTTHTSGNHATPCRFCMPLSIPPTIAMHDPTPTSEPGEPVGPIIPGVLPSDGVIGGWTSRGLVRQPPPPDDPSTKAKKFPVKVSEGVQSAMLVRRVQPVYPTIAIQTRREGRVELHAIIATDGSIQSLEVISGEPWFIQSALAAVREWHYRPTILNGQPVEVDTRITVIYTLSR